MRAVCIGRQEAAAIRRTDLEPRKRSSVPSKIRCDKAIVVSRALPMALVNRPMPFSRPLGSSSFLAVNRAATGSPLWEAYGGSGAGILGLTIAIEEVAKYSNTAALMLLLTRLPTGPVMIAGSMLLEHIGERTAADRLMAAVREAIASKEAVTPDLGGSAAWLPRCTSMVRSGKNRPPGGVIGPTPRVILCTGCLRAPWPRSFRRAVSSWRRERCCRRSASRARA